MTSSFAGLLRDLDRLDTTLGSNRSALHGFLQRLLTVRGISVESAVAMLESMVRRARSRMQASDNERRAAPSPSIPKIIHRIWLTHPDSPHEPRADYIGPLVADADRHFERGWQTWVWVQDPARLPLTSALCAAHSDSVRIRTIDAVRRGEGWENAFDRLMADDKYPFASDLLRVRILREFGGCYADLGLRFKSPDFLCALAENFDYAMILWETLFFQNSLLLMPPESEVARIFMQIADRPETLPVEIFHDFDAIEEGMAFSGLLITALLLLTSARHARICPLFPNGEAIEWRSERSWYTRSESGATKYGNAFVPDAPASFLRKDALAACAPHDVLDGRECRSPRDNERHQLERHQWRTGLGAGGCR